jgi:cytochrome c556
MKKQVIAVACTAVLAAGGTALAQQKPEDTIKYRQSALFILGQNFGPLAAMAQGKVPYDKDAAVRYAEIAAFVVKLPWNSFGPGTDTGGNTKAKPGIWQNLDDFHAKRDKMLSEIEKLPAAAGDLDSLKAQVGATGKACKACHDEYRAK